MEQIIQPLKRKRTIRRRGGKFNISDAGWNSVLAKFGNRCLCCGDTGVVLTKDHIIPRSKGGSNGRDNLQPLCEKCNQNKGDEIIDYRK